MKHGRLMAIAGLVMLAACSGNDVKTSLGLDRGAPDEFRVVSRPPLSVPPQFNLRPPASAADPMPGQTPASAQAQALLTGSNAPTGGVTVGTAVAAPAAAPSPPGTSAESAFLSNVGASQADPTVRYKIAEDQIIAETPPPEEKSWYNFWSSSDKPKPEPLVNANQESQRIKTNDDSGQPVTAGDTPVVKQRDTGLMGQIFGY